MLNLVGSSFEALGENLDDFNAALTLANGTSGDNTIEGCSFSAPAGSIQFGGSAGLLVSGSKIDSGATTSYAGFVCGPGNFATGCNLVDTKVKTTSPIRFVGLRASVSGSALTSDGANEDGTGILFGAGSGSTLIESKVSAKAGSIEFRSGGACTLTDSKFAAFGANETLAFFGAPEDNAPVGTLFSCSGTTVTGSSFKAVNGSFTFVGSGPTVDTSRFLTKATTGAMFGNFGTAAVTNSKFSAPLGDFQFRGVTFTLGGNKMKSGNYGFLMESSVASSIADSKLKTTSLLVRSLGDTSVSNSGLASSGARELSANGICTSTGNKPDIPCI